jgi:hypothetical protein
MADLLALLINVLATTSVTDSDRESAVEFGCFGTDAVCELMPNVFRSDEPIAVSAMQLNCGTIFHISPVHILGTVLVLLWKLRPRISF